MAASVELFRAYTIPGFHEIRSRDLSTFKAWVTNSKFKISQNKTKTAFVLDVYNKKDLVSALAFDINRMASASFESIIGIAKEQRFPRSVGWLTIRLYYSAYFSAHVILRFFGVSCTMLDAAQTRAIDKVYTLYGFDLAGCSTNSAYYSCHYDTQSNRIYGSQLANTHQDVWMVFYKLLEGLADRIPSSDFLQTDRQEALLFVLGLRERLSKRNVIASGHWLSMVRNDVNYALGMGAWFPYSGSSGDHDNILRLVTSWSSQPPELNLGSISDKDSVIFVEACLAIVSLARELVVDVDSIEPKSFLANGAIKCLNICRRNQGARVLET